MKGLVEEVEKIEEDGRRGLSSKRKEFIRSERELDLATVTGDNVDWAGQAGAVHDQGYCGSCWAFTANTVLEGTIALRDTTNPGLTELSDQMPTNCTWCSWANR